MAAVDVNDLIEFLTKCNDEDEAAAKAAASETWRVDRETGYFHVYSEDDGIAFDLSPGDADHIALHDPARVLRECAARREVIALWRSWQKPDTKEDPLYVAGVTNTLARVLKQDAESAYADRPGFRDEWRVT